VRRTTGCHPSLARGVVELCVLAISSTLRPSVLETASGPIRQRDSVHIPLPIPLPSRVTINGHLLASRTPRSRAATMNRPDRERPPLGDSGLRRRSRGRIGNVPLAYPQARRSSRVRRPVPQRIPGSARHPARPVSKEEGSVAIFSTRDAAQEFAEGDPLVINGVVLKWTLRE
jgi:hypothetical protein